VNRSKRPAGRPVVEEWYALFGLVSHLNEVSSLVIAICISLLISVPTITQMSDHKTTSNKFLDEFRNFHSDFPYNHSEWRNNLVLESREGVRFHFPGKKLIAASAFFAGAPILTPSEDEAPIPDQGRLQPIPLTFASSACLCHLLVVLRNTTIGEAKASRRSSSQSKIQEPLWRVVIDTVRIADVLEAPELARAV
jgi:hypothetical protein